MINLEVPPSSLKWDLPSPGDDFKTDSNQKKTSLFAFCMRYLIYLFQVLLIPTILALILYNNTYIFRQILRSPPFLYTNQFFSCVKDVCTMRTPHSAICRTNVASLLFVDPIFSIYIWALKNPNGPGIICRGILFTCCQMPSQHSTWPLSTNILPLTYHNYCQTQQPDCCVYVDPHKHTTRVCKQGVPIICKFGGLAPRIHTEIPHMHMGTPHMHMGAFFWAAIIAETRHASESCLADFIFSLMLTVMTLLFTACSCPSLP